MSGISGMSNMEAQIIGMLKIKREGNMMQYYRNMSSLSHEEAVELIDALLDREIQRENNNT